MSPGEFSLVEPDVVRVSVLGADTQMDLGLPATIPIAALIPDLLGQLRSRSTGGAETRPRRWTLAQIGRPPIDPGRTLAESGVRDGDLLLLRSAEHDDAPVLFDDVVDAIAGLTESTGSRWTPAAASIVGRGVGVTSAVIAALALCLAGAGGSAVAAVIAALAAAGFLTAAAITSRQKADPRNALSVSTCGVPLAFALGLSAIPGGIGWAHLALAAAITVLYSVLSYRIIAVGPAVHSALTTAGILITAICTAALLLDASLSHAAAVGAAVGLAAVCAAPRLTILLTKLPLPPVPTAGDAVALIESDLTPTIDGLSAIGTVTLPNTETLERRARTAASYLTGIICGTTIVTVIAALTSSLVPLREHNWTAVAYALLLASILCLRGRSHTDLRQAGVLIVGGFVIVGGMLLLAVLVADISPLVTALLALVLGVIGLLLGTVAAGHDFSPPLRRVAEIIEYLLVACVVPVLIWILGLYAAVRNL